MDGVYAFWQSMGIANLDLGQLFMMLVGGLLIYLAINKKFEPLLLLPIGFGAVLANIPVAGIADEGGLLWYFYHVGIETGVFPLLIFMGVGALTDFSALIAMPKTLFLGAAAQFGIFATLLGALSLNLIPGFNFSLADASAIAIIGGADGPTAIFLASRLAPDLLGAIAVAAYSYMALVPIIQPPIMRAFHRKGAQGGHVPVAPGEQAGEDPVSSHCPYPLHPVSTLCGTPDWHAHVRQPAA